MALLSAGPSPATGVSYKATGSKSLLKYPKTETYGAEIRCARLRRLQQLLSDGGNCANDAIRPQVLLGIFGIDSRYNEGMHELIDYLTFGGFETFKAELERHGYDEEDVSDAMVCIRHDRVDVYCSAASYRCLVAHFGSWRNLRIHCLGKRSGDDTDEAEEFKVKTLVTMVNGCQTVGLPFSARNHRVPFEPMKVEQWPLIQAYALEGYGRGAFFTLEHSVVDLSEELHAVYREVDPASLMLLTTEVLPCFEKQWDNMERSIDVALSGDATQSLSTDQIAEPLLTYHSHGQVSFDLNQSVTEGRKPYVFFGKDTNRIVAQSSSAAPSYTFSPPSNKGLSASEIGTHMVSQAVSPRNDICCSRTYFFESDATSPMTDDTLRQSTHVDRCRHLHEIYKAAIEAVTESIAVYCTSMSASVAKASQAALAIVEKKRSSQCSFSVCFFLQAIDKLDRIITAPDCGKNLYPKTAQVIVSDISCRIGDVDMHLGAITFGECFIESTILHSDSGGEADSLSSDFVILTRNVPRWTSWHVSATERQLWASIPGRLSFEGLFGKLLLPGYSVDVAANNCCMRLAPGSLFLYENGIAFVNTRAGPFVIPTDAINTIEFYDGDSPSVPAFVIVRLDRAYQAIIPDYLQSEFMHVVFVLMPKTKAYKAFFSEVLHAWKSSEVTGTTFRIVEALSEDLLPVQEAAQARLAGDRSAGAGAGASGDGLRALGGIRQNQLSTLPALGRFVNHLTAHYCLSSKRVLTRDLPVLLKLSLAANNSTAEEPTSDTVESTPQLVVTVVSGVPGSRKESLCNALTALAQENSRWVVFKQPLDAAVQRLNIDNLQATIQQYYGNLKKKKVSGSSSKCSRMLVVTPGYTEACEVVQAVLNHPNPEVAAHVQIGAVTTCVDPLNAFVNGRCTLPRLLDMCALGWVNNIVFTSSTDFKSEPLLAIQELLRCVNNNVAFLLADKGEVTRSTDIDLILSETAFDDASLRRSRILCSPESPEDCHASIVSKCSPMSQCVLKFSQPLVKARLLSQLKALKHSLDGFSNGSIYHVVGRVKFEDADTTYEVTHTTLSSSTHTEPAAMAPTSPSHSSTSAAGSTAPAQRWFLIFVGYGLQDSVLRDWLRKCAIPRPEMLQLKTVGKLSFAEKKQIHHARHHEPLPPGWFYNGSQYVSLMGERSEQHPNMASFLEEYVEEQNRQAKEHNERLARAALRDLFD